MAPGDRRPRARLEVVVTLPDRGPARAPGLAAWLAEVAPRTARGEVTVALVSDTRMRVLNRAYRGKDYATDVLSFPTAEPGLTPRRARPSPKARPYTVAEDIGGSLGDIVIATGVARRQASEAGHAFGTELRLLALHGMLHLLGYDHETDAGEMQRVEARLRRKGGLSAGLIERSETTRRAPRPPAARKRRRPTR
jgi:probable rRNA maturation factor